MYTKDELKALGVKNIEEARKKIVNISLFDHIDDLTIKPNVQNILEYTLEEYMDYLNMLNSIPKTSKEKILRALKNTEVIDNHSLERENVNLLEDYNESHHSTAINYLLKKLQTEKMLLNSEILKKAHEILMRGTSNESSISSLYRKNNNFFVGTTVNGINEIDYFPISYTEIKRALDLFFEYYNGHVHSIYDIFIRPFIAHALLAILQVFEDGNTRISRINQAVKMYDITKLYLDNTLPLPVIYLSKTYYIYRHQYRELLSNIANSPNEETWNSWIRFNLNLLQEQITYNTNTIARTRKLN